MKALYRTLLLIISIVIFLIVSIAHRSPWWWVSAYWGINILLNGNALISENITVVVDEEIEQDDTGNTEENKGDSESL